MNLIDGLDGLSSGVAVVILLSYGYLGYKYNDLFLLYTSSILIVTLFLFYNWYPSKLFMGDSGSLTLGFIIVILSIHSVQKGYIAPVTVLLLTAVPILDTLIVMIRRLRRRKNPFHPDKSHIHHIILKQHYKNVSKTTKILILLQIVFIYVGLEFKVKDDLVILTMFILLFVLFYYLLTPTKINKKDSVQK
jgi:UDP-GlcNAc:undecaprenyl-phosphate GlcNAc-1-phosphate transferase